MVAHPVGQKVDEYYSGLNHFGDHGHVEEDLIANYREGMTLEPTKTYEELKPDVWRMDVTDDTVTVDPMRYNRWITDPVGLRVYNESNLRKREFNAQGFQRAKAGLIDCPQPQSLFLPTTHQLDQIPHWQTHCGVYQPSRRGVYRDLSRVKMLPLHLAAKYSGVLTNKSSGDIELEIRESNRKLLDRVFDCSGYCR